MAEKQKEMAVIQRENQKKMMEEQMKKQLSMAMASQRELLNWELSAYGTFATVFTLGKLARRPVPHVAVVPLVVAPVILAYQWDFAYGTKADRIKAEADKILVTFFLWASFFLYHP